MPKPREEVRKIVEAISGRNGYELLHSDDVPSLVIIGEHNHYDLGLKEVEMEIILSIEPEFVLHERMNDAPAMPLPGDYAVRQELLGEKNVAFPILEAVDAVKARYGGCRMGTRGQREFIRRYPRLTTRFGNEAYPISAAVKFMKNKFLDADKASKDTRTLEEVELFIEADSMMGSPELLEYGNRQMSAILNFYGKYGLTFGIIGQRHIYGINGIEVPYMSVNSVSRVDRQ